MKFSRNYQKIFEALSMEQIYRSDCEELGGVLRLFQSKSFSKK